MSNSDWRLRARCVKGSPEHGLIEGELYELADHEIRAREEAEEVEYLVNGHWWPVDPHFQVVEVN